MEPDRWCSGDYGFAFGRGFGWGHGFVFDTLMKMDGCGPYGCGNLRGDGNGYACFGDLFWQRLK